MKTINEASPCQETLYSMIDVVEENLGIEKVVNYLETHLDMQYVGTFTAKLDTDKYIDNMLFYALDRFWHIYEVNEESQTIVLSTINAIPAVSFASAVLDKSNETYIKKLIKDDLNNTYTLCTDIPY